MSTTQKPLYGASTGITATGLTTLASHALNGWQSGYIDNSVDLALGVWITVSVTLGAGSPASDKTVYCYIYESEDGVNYTDNATGAVGTLTRRDPTNFKPLGNIYTPDLGALTYKKTFLYAPALMPRRWGLYINNMSNLAFSNAVVTYTPVQAQSV